MYTIYMRESGILICSVFEYNHQSYIRFSKVSSIEEYKNCLNFWYPNMEWKLHEHKAWFHLSGNLDNIFSIIEGHVKHLYGNVKSNKSSQGIYYCVGIKHILRESFFEDIHKIIVNEIENDEDNTEDLLKELKKHKYEAKCMIFGLSRKFLEKEESINTETYNYKDMLINDVFYVDIKCREYTIDPWNEEYPIVWSSNALKDFIFAVKKHNIILSSWQISKHLTKNVSNFWMIDDTLNIRSKSETAAITNSDIFYLFTQIGNIEGYFEGLYLDYCDNNAAEMLNEYYELLNLRKGLDTPEPICSTLPHGKLFGHYEIFYDEIFYDENIPTKEEEKPINEVALLANHITKTIECILQPSYIVSLPEIEVLHTIKLVDKAYGDLLIKEFNKYKDVQSCLQEDLSVLLSKKMNYVNENGSSDETKQNETEIPVKNIYTTRHAIEYILKIGKLIPTDKWCPASMALDIFSKYIQLLQTRKKEFASLQCQRNQLSIILADIVPKKRFVSGQMFQLQLPSPLLIEKTVCELISNT